MTKDNTLTEKQVDFMKAVLAHDNEVSSFELKLEGLQFASGVFNSLVTKRLVIKNDNKRKFTILETCNNITIGAHEKEYNTYSVTEAGLRVLQSYNT